MQSNIYFDLSFNITYQNYFKSVLYFYWYFQANDLYKTEDSNQQTNASRWNIGDNIKSQYHFYYALTRAFFCLSL